MRGYNIVVCVQLRNCQMTNVIFMCLDLQIKCSFNVCQTCTVLWDASLFMEQEMQTKWKYFSLRFMLLYVLDSCSLCVIPASVFNVFSLI